MTEFYAYGNVCHRVCPICGEPDTHSIWKIPFHRTREELRVNKMSVQFFPAFGANEYYEYFRCDACESIFLNPFDYLKKQEYASPHDARAIRKIQRTADRNDASWKGYVSRYEYMRPYISEKADVLIDAACGGGQYLILAREDQNLHAKRIIGLDLSPSVVQSVSTAGFEGHQCDLDCSQSLQVIPSATADFIIFSEAFEHVVLPFESMSNLVALLKGGARLFFSAQRVDSELPVRPGENYCITTKGIEILVDRLGCRFVDRRESRGKWLAVIEKP